MDVLQHFNLKELPFSLTPNLEFFCPLRNHSNAIDTLLFHLDAGESLIKVIGEVGTGKTLLCRKLLHSLADKDFITCYIPNPDLDKESLRRFVASELGYESDDQGKQFDVIEHIYHMLIEHHRAGKKVVLVVDESQVLSDEGIETIRLLTNLETEKHKLLQIVLFGQPELDENLSTPQLRQVRQRINFSYYLEPLTQDEMEHYVSKRLLKAGHPTGQIFDKDAAKLLYKASGGIPRVIHTLTYKAMLITWEEQQHKITKKIMKETIVLSEDVYTNDPRDILRKWVYGACFVVAFCIVCYMLYTLWNDFYR